MSVLKELKCFDNGELMKVECTSTVYFAVGRDDDVRWSGRWLSQSVNAPMAPDISPMGCWETFVMMIMILSSTRQSMAGAYCTRTVCSRSHEMYG